MAEKKTSASAADADAQEKTDAANADNTPAEDGVVVPQNDGGVATVAGRDPKDQTPGIGYFEPPSPGSTIIERPNNVTNVSDEEMHRGDQETDPKKLKQAQLKQAGLA